MPANTVKCDRSGRHGNPFNATQRWACFSHRGYPMPGVSLYSPATIERCLDMFVGYLWGVLAVDPDFLRPLVGKNLGCWCHVCERHLTGRPLDEPRCADCAPCHVDILGRFANFEAWQ